MTDLINVSGKLYGTTLVGGRGGNCNYQPGCGTVFALDRSTGAYAVAYSFGANSTDAGNPFAGVINVHGLLYGTTSYGGTGDKGTVFSVDPSTGTDSVLYSFCTQPNCADGYDPTAELLNVNGKLYGTTYVGGANGQGTVFELKTKR